MQEDPPLVPFRINCCLLPAACRSPHHNIHLPLAFSSAFDDQHRHNIRPKHYTHETRWKRLRPKHGISAQPWRASSSCESTAGALPCLDYVDESTSLTYPKAQLELVGWIRFSDCECAPPRDTKRPALVRPPEPRAPAAVPG